MNKYFYCYNYNMNSQKKILIADDDAAMANVLSLKLTHEGFTAQIANNGQEAIDLLITGGFSVALMDLMMDKKDGFTVLAEMKSKNITIPVIVTSNLGQEEDKTKALSLGAKDYFVKSNTPLSQIIERVKSLI